MPLVGLSGHAPHTELSTATSLFLHKGEMIGRSTAWCRALHFVHV